VYVYACVCLCVCCLGIYTTFVMLMNTSSVMLTVLVLNLHHRNECRPVPNWLRTFALVGLARLLCMYSKETLTIFPQDRRKSSMFQPADFIAGRCNTAASLANKQLFTKRNEFSGKRLSNCSSEIKRLAAGQCQQNSSSFANYANKTMHSPKAIVTQRTSSLTSSVTDRASSHNDVHRKFCLSGNHATDENYDCFKTTAMEEEERMVMPTGEVINLEMQEWKQLARIMDRLFFWMTLTALISVSVVLSCLRFYI